MNGLRAEHEFLGCGVELASLALPRRHVVTFEIRVLAGMCEEPPDRLGLARIVEDTLTKGTQRRSAKELSDAFDALGAIRGSGAGRETTTFSCTVLPQHFDAAVALHAEFLRTPTFPQDMVEVSVELGRQEFLALDDDPQELVDKYISRQAFGSVVGRHELGEPETLSRITREDVARFWQRVAAGGTMQVSVAGPVAHAQARDVFEKHFAGFGSRDRRGRTPYPVEFNAVTTHHEKELEQEQMSLCFPGVYVADPQYPVQRVLIGVLAGGMSGRLFTEVREKQGLVYWVGAWAEAPRGTGMIFLGASTTPQRCDQTYRTLFREVDRLGEDLAEEELDRAKAAITARVETRGSTTRSLCGEMADDLFHRGRPVPQEEKLDQVRKVTVADIRDFLASHPRDRMCVVTLGPKALEQA